MIKTVLFDLDGTIINSEEGITNCVRYVLDYWGLEYPAQEELRCFIGPPLREQFIRMFGWSPEKAEESVIKFRERFDVLGLYECELYPGIQKLIEELDKLGYQIALASSKHEEACGRIIRHFHLESHFAGIFGATRDGRISSKKQVLEIALEKLGAKKDETVLIGDTRFDVLGAKEAGIGCIGVTYGFGTREELKTSGAMAIADTAEELLALLWSREDSACL